MGIVGFRVRGNVAGFAFALALLGLLRGLVANIGLLGARPVFVVSLVPGMSEGGLVAIIAALQCRVESYHGS
jgi:hypothetical protein